MADQLETAAGRGLVSVTERIELADPAASIFAARRASERWFCWSEPERDFELAALGSISEVVSRGPNRFDDVRDYVSGVRPSSQAEGLPAGAGPTWVGGFSFDPAGCREAHWSSLPPALMFLPELSVVRDGAESYLTLNAMAEPGEGADAALARARRRLAALGEARLPMLDPAPTGQVRVASAADPSAYESAVAAAVQRIREGGLEKVVLAREVRAEAPQALEAGALFGALRELFPSCYCFCVGTPETAFIGASPELLVRRRGAGAQTVALAGSARRSADPSVDDHLAEQLLRSHKDRSEHGIVVRRIEQGLRRHAVWVEAANEPIVVKVANIQHLATPIHAQLAEPRSAVELAGMLHPTPAVGGEPSREATELIADLENLDRGWYAAPVGWMDSTEDGEFCVALRSALLRDRTAHLFAGCGIVADSDPAAELAETELKLDALLPLLAG